MNTTSVNHLIDHKVPLIVRKRPKVASSRIFGFAMFALVTILFGLEFSRILNAAVKVNQVPSVQAGKLASASRPST